MGRSLGNNTYIEQVLPIHWSLQVVELREVGLEPRIALDLFEDFCGRKFSEVRDIHHPDLRVLEHLKQK
jgi:hypothetical protein